MPKIVSMIVHGEDSQDIKKQNYKKILSIEKHFHKILFQRSFRWGTREVN